MPRLQDRVVIVTGGGHGIGRAYCRGLAAEGAGVAVVDIDGIAAERVADEIREGGGQAIPIAVDVSDESRTEMMAKETVDRLGGRIDGLVNNAAIFKTIRSPSGGLEGTQVDEWDRLMAVNVRGVWLCAKAVVPYMKAQNYGKIVNISSTGALQGLTPFGAYPTSKGAVITMTRGMARDLGQYNITVNCVAPGGTMSDDDVTEDVLRASQRTVEVGRDGRVTGQTIRAIKRIETPDDLVGTVVFLCSGESDFVSGQIIAVDGGSYMG